MGDYIQTKLKNNIKVLLIPKKDIKIVHMSLMFRVGSDLETINPKNTLETSHFLEHMFGAFTSTKYPDSYNLLEKLVSLGITSNASVDYNTTKYFLKGLHKHIEFIIDILYNAYFNFLIDEKYFEQERQAVIEELNNILNDGWIKLTEDVNSKLYPHHIRSLSQTHNIKNVKKLKSKDLLSFFKKYYTKNNLLISVAGDFNVKKIMRLLNATFGNIRHRSTINKFNNILIDRKYQLSYTKNSNTMSSNIYIIFPINYNMFNLNKYIIMTISNLLTYGLDSRLYKKLRGKKGLVYGISSDIELSATSKNLSYFSLNTQVADKNLVKVIHFIIEELNMLQMNKIEESEIVKHMSDTKVTYISNNLDKDPSRILNRYSRYILWGKEPITEKEEYDFLLDINQNNILKMSREIFDFSKMMIIYSGKTNVNDKINKLLKQFKI
tara:strand:+ start:958 stop:2271 length:1314 start_codon:yes stop_codon:yes gene_type:complete